MDDIFSAVRQWDIQKKPMALATLVNTWGSSPRGIGAKMVINKDGEMAGSVSGGCVESAVVEAGVEVIQTGLPVLLYFGVPDETAWEVGLACGGEIEVFIQPLNLSIFQSLESAWEDGIPAIRAFVIQGPGDLKGKEIVLSEGGGFFPTLIRNYIVDIELLGRQALDRGVSERHRYSSPEGENIEVFLDYIAPAGTMIIVGGVHIAIHLVTIGNELGFRTIIIDPRQKFTDQERFSNADQILQEWPKFALSSIKLTSRSAVVILTHDPKIDDQALGMALDSPAFYVGALGSKNTQFERRKRLLEKGVDKNALERIRGPIGLDIGSRSPAEIAVAIMAEIIQTQNKGY